MRAVAWLPLALADCCAEGLHCPDSLSCAQRPDCALGADGEYWRCPVMNEQLAAACAETPQSGGCKGQYSSTVPYFKYPNEWYARVRAIAKKTPKRHKFCFLGTSQPCRWWVQEFARKYFDTSSVLVFTDEKPKQFDFRGNKLDAPLPSEQLKTKRPYKAFRPAEQQAAWWNTEEEKEKIRALKTTFDEGYFEALAGCEYALAPRGGEPYSMRFYEALAAGAVPVLQNFTNQRRSPQEFKLVHDRKYQFVLLPEQWADDTGPWHVQEALKVFSGADYASAQRQNQILFEQHHLLTATERMPYGQRLLRKMKAIALPQQEQSSAAPQAATANATLSARPLLFAHIPKNAGTTIEDVGKRAGTTWGRFMPLAKTTQVPGGECSTWHTPPAKVASPNPYASPSADVFCVTRDPWDRMLSEYAYMIQTHDKWPQRPPAKFPGLRRYWDLTAPFVRAGPVCTKAGFNAFIKMGIEKMKHGQRYINDCHFLPQWDYIEADGKVWCNHRLPIDDLTNSFNALMERRGLPARLTPHTESPGTVSTTCPELKQQIARPRKGGLFTAESQALMRDVYAEDFKHLGDALADAKPKKAFLRKP